MERLYTAAELAAMFGCHVKTVRVLISKGKIPHIRIGAGSVRIRESDLQAWLDSRRVPGELPVSEAATP